MVSGTADISISGWRRPQRLWKRSEIAPTSGSETASTMLATR